MSLLLIVLAIFFGWVVWMTGSRLRRLLRTAAEGHRGGAMPAPFAVTARTGSD